LALDGGDVGVTLDLGGDLGRGAHVEGQLVAGFERSFGEGDANRAYVNALVSIGRVVGRTTQGGEEPEERTSRANDEKMGHGERGLDGG
jgi:hypothetical protein